jgi:hypothetical protein
MQLIPQSLPLVQFGGFRPPLAIDAVDGAVRVMGADDCIGAGEVVAVVFGFIMPENIEGFLAGAAAGAAIAAAGAGVAAAALHDIRLCVVGSWQ